MNIIATVGLGLSIGTLVWVLLSPYPTKFTGVGIEFAHQGDRQPILNSENFAFCALTGIILGSLKTADKNLGCRLE
ncbi:MAG: hypothetical protein ACLP4V_34115 [Methylocella sp.]